MAGELAVIAKAVAIVGAAKRAHANHQTALAASAEAQKAFEAAEAKRAKAIEAVKTQTEQDVRAAHQKHDAALRHVDEASKILAAAKKHVDTFVAG